MLRPTPTSAKKRSSNSAFSAPASSKYLSFHNPTALRKLAANHPKSRWVVRAFLDFGGRSLNPQRFFNDTISDMQRTLTILQGQDVVIELHNEPNLTPEGLSSSWADGAEFATWWLRLLRLYRHVLPNHRYIYPGLSPGTDVSGLRQNHVRFLEASRAAIEEADGLGVHTYWSVHYSMNHALAVLDDVLSRFPGQTGVDYGSQQQQEWHHAVGQGGRVP